MAAFKFFNIGKANQEIERLNAELTKVSAERDEARAAVEGNNSEAVSAGEELQVKLDMANKSIETITAENAQLKDASAKHATELAGVKAELETAKATIAGEPERITKAAATKAAEITSAQGQEPIKTSPVTSPAGGKENSGLKGIAKVQAAFKAQLDKTK
jgi:SMC interacting uncharacterized protein involved in chromosome segregation